MVISKLLKTQAINKHNELVNQLQQEARTFFYDRMMYEVNDALASILAACDVEGKEAVPKIKQYIHRINQSLNNTKNYQSKLEEDKKYNVSVVMENLLHVIKDNFKERRLTSLISDIKAPVVGDQSQFEKLLLHVFVNMLTQRNESESDILIELRQKDQDAMITILKDSHSFSEDVLKMIEEIKISGKFTGSIKITPHGKGIEVIIKIPLQFKVVTISQAATNKSARKGKKRASARIKKTKADWRSAAEHEMRMPGFAF